MNSALYIHIPFCTSKCWYCSFNSYAGLEAVQSRYVDTLCAQMENEATEVSVVPLETIFIGGGTPSILSGELLSKILTAIKANFAVVKDVEFSIEANPGTVDIKKLKNLHRSGVNRISFGVQSFIDTELKQIGRVHSVKEAEQAVSLAIKAGFRNISIDLMYGLPGQTKDTWRSSLERALALEVNHLSLYELTVEKQTVMGQMKESGILLLPVEDELLAMDEITAKRTAEAGFAQYEISNYAKNGYQCRHNIGYWKNKEYFGIGAGAVAYRAGIRKKSVVDPVQYCRLLEAGKTVFVEEEILQKDASFRETVIMGLRMNRGVSLLELSDRFEMEVEHYYGKCLRKLLDERLLKLSNNYLKLTDRGRIYANRVMAELV